MRPRGTWIACAVAAGALVLGACGDDDGGGGGGGGLSANEKLTVIQARADISEFCSVQDTGEGPLFDRNFESMLTAVRDLARVYRENADARIEIPVEKKSLTLEQVMREQIKALRNNCGRDGRQQSGVLDAALQQQTASS
jgi:hypothetical protein